MSHKMIPFSPPDISASEIEAVIEVMKSGWITTGPVCKKFEKNLATFCGMNCFATTNSATSSMEMTLRLLGVGPGDQVITSAYTYTASASVIDHVGAEVVLVDTMPDSVEMDYEQLASKLTERTKVIIPVDIAGVMVDYDRLFEVLEAKKALYHPKEGTLQTAFDRVVVMADAAHSLGATYKNQKAGQVADFTCFSFHAVKNLTTAEGGGVTWKPIAQLSDEEIYKQFMLFILHGQTKDALSKDKAGAWEYDIVAPLYKANMTDIHAAIGNAQLERYEDILAHRRALVARYEEGLADLPVTFLKHSTDRGESSVHLFLMRIEGYDVAERNQLIEYLATKNISTNVHYKPLPMLTAYRNMGFEIQDFPNAYNYYRNEITLPLNSLMTLEDVDYVVEELHNYLK